MSKDPTEFEGRFFAAVQLTRPLLRHITGAVEAGLRRWDISVVQRAILEALLFRPGSSLPVLTEILQLKRQFIHRILQEVTEAGLAAATPNPARRGASLYWLTEKGEQAIRAIRAGELEQLEIFLAGHPAPDIEAFIRVQSALARYFQGLAAGGPDSGEDMSC